MVESTTLDQIEETTRGFQEAPAEIALRHRLLEPEQIDWLLSKSGARDGPDLLIRAQQKGLLSADRSDQVRKLHALREVLEIGETLVLNDLLSTESLVSELTRFFSECLPTTGPGAGNDSMAANPP